MGRIGQSLIMLGQPPYCSLFSVWWVDEEGYMCVGVAGMCANVHECVHGCAPRKMGQGYCREKVPTLSHPPPPCAPHVYASSNWILYYRSSQVWTSHFPLPILTFSFFLSLYVLFSLYSFLAFFFSFLLIERARKILLFRFTRVERALQTLAMPGWALQLTFVLIIFLGQLNLTGSRIYCHAPKPGD